MLRGLLLMLCVFAATAPAAIAAEDEIFVDPGSPSGKEYALPIDSAREQAASDRRGKSSRGKAAPLFGEGVDAGSAGSAGGGGSGSGTGGSGRDGAGSAGGERTAQSQGESADGGIPVTARAQAASPDGGTGTIAIIGAGAGVLLLGGAIGLVLRRRSARAA